jgi:ABC-type Na+ efflux pump permease subunit/membrane protease YdiL (CAAX protease family)
MEKLDSDNIGEPADPPSGSGRASPLTATPSDKSRFRLSRLARKELRETLRDRRTLVTLILMPLLVYPILSLVFKTFLLNTAASLSPPKVIQYRYLVDGSDKNQVSQVLQAVAQVSQRYEKRQNDESQNGVPSNPANEKSQNGEPAVPPMQPTIASFKQHQWMTQPEDENRPIQEVVAAGEADAGIMLSVNVLKDDRWIAKYDVVYDPNNLRSAEAAAYLKQQFLSFNQSVLLGELRKTGVKAYFPMNEGDDSLVSIAPSDKTRSGISMASLIPLILVLMTITGAVYPAIDLTAGERERGTLETLMAAPIPRMGILFSKFIAVLTVAVLTASLNIVGMAATIWAFRLDSYLGETGFTLEMCLKVFGLLVLFAAFYSAVLLAVTSYARSFKEAQSYLVPIILLSMAPGLMAMTPGLTLEGPLCVTPMVNILLLARDVLQGSVQIVPSLIAIGATFVYTALAVLMAARIFGTDAILYGSQSSWSEMFIRPAKPQTSMPLSAMVFCLVMLIPINFVLSGFLNRLDADMTWRLLLMGLFTALMFFVFPWIVASFLRVSVADGFGLRSAAAVYFVGAGLLGLSLWPLVMSMTEAWHEIYKWIAGAEQSQNWQDRLVEFGTAAAAKFRLVSPWIIALTLSIVPAFCEEWFFRGMLLRTLLTHKSKWIAILVSAAIFGLFHVMSSSTIALDRFLPTAMIGIILGYLCYKSGSILPGVFLHATHNAIVAFLAYYQPQLSRLDWFIGENDSVPLSWVLISLVPALLGLALIVFSARRLEASPRATRLDSILGND